MKQILLSKQSEHAQIGHLYEHLYCHQLAQAFRSKGLFAYVDYGINGKTYYDGRVEVEVSLYTEMALRQESLVAEISIEINEDIISGGLLQLMAEKRVDVWDRDDTIIVRLLSALDAGAWVYYEGKTGLPSSGSRSEEGLIFTQKTQRNFLNMTQKISFDLGSVSMDEEDAAALFSVVSASIRENLQEEFAQTLFCYSVKDSFKKQGVLLVDVNIYRVDRRQATTLSDEDEIVARLLQLMRREGFIERLSEFLLTARADESSGMPSNETMHEKLSLTLDEKRWRAIGTVSNVNAVFSKVIIDLKLGTSSRQITQP